MSRVDLADINLNLLVALDALLGERSVAAAAQATGVTPSAMSHALSQLRGILGDQLLVRAGRGMALTPKAAELAQPLHRVLLDAQALLHNRASFEPATARRHYVLAAPDFLATLLLPDLVTAIRGEAPGITLEVVPSARRGNAWMLETGELDLALGAIVDDAPGIRRTDLYTEGFSCAVRKDHPRIQRTLSLEQYASAEHLLITLGDDHRPTWADEAMARLGLSRRVVLRVRFFMAAPLIVARTDLLVTAPSMLIRYFATLVPLQVFEPPIGLPTYPEEVYWHDRYQNDPAHRFLRKHLLGLGRRLGIDKSPERRSWRP